MSFVGVGSFIGAMVIASMSKHGPQKFVLIGLPFIFIHVFDFNSITSVYILTDCVLQLQGCCCVVQLDCKFYNAA
jgi:predicted MFS family arabinose efflux permease